MKALLQESRQPARSSAPPSGPIGSGIVPHPMPPHLTPCHPPAPLWHHVAQAPHHATATHPPAPAEQGSASGEFFGGFGVFLLALPPGSHGLNKKLFGDRPLFLLTPRPPRRLWSLRTLSQSPSPKARRQRIHHSSFPRVVSPGGFWLSSVRVSQRFGVVTFKAVRRNMSRAPVHPLPWLSWC